MTLYHYCCHHSAYAIEHDRFTLRPGLDGWLWLTDLDHADRRGLGLTSNYLSCDRTECRFVVDDPIEVVRWIDIRKALPPVLVRELEGDPRVLLAHWYLTTHVQAAREA